ncbi:MAG: hypothetical protein JETT_2613 [Candidatus Jettenia ecosi]|uniref:Uncharacterized protein n=1 Tax=Candidatus Jettenia ecosi TaxID=2494326 RepID=A0A533Q8Y7_9BACT|nr:MAG: hypothetical protein JETT_2613 [Candidatus Jettenia ecosi]
MIVREFFEKQIFLRYVWTKEGIIRQIYQRGSEHAGIYGAVRESV